MPRMRNCSQNRENATILTYFHGYKNALIKLIAETEVAEQVYNSNAIENSTLTLEETRKDNNLMINSSPTARGIRRLLLIHPDAPERSARSSREDANPKAA